MGLCSSAHAAGLYLLESCRRARAVGFETWMHPPATSCLCQLPHACAAFPCSCWPFLVGAVSLCPWRGRVLNTADATIERGLLVSVAEPFHRGVIAKRMTSSGTRSNIRFDGIRHSLRRRGVRPRCESREPSLPSSSAPNRLACARGGRQRAHGGALRSGSQDC